MDPMHQPAGVFRTVFTLIVGLAVLAAGVFGTWHYGRYGLYIYESMSDAGSPFVWQTALLGALWLMAAVMLAIAGLSLVISALVRRTRNLIPGPTLYLLGLAIFGIGIYFLIYQQTLPGVAAVLLGLVICYWEYAFDVS